MPSFNLYYLVFNCKDGPTADKKVRQALSYGFDYQTWVNDVMRGKAQQARGPIPSNFIGFNPNTPQYTYDPDKAQQLLADAGYPDGGFEIDYTYETGYFWKRPLGELFQSNMADLGVTVNIQELSPSAWADLLSNPETARHAFGLVWWPTLGRPTTYMFSLFATGAQGTAGYNWGYYSNPELDKLLEQGTAEVDEAKRTEIYNQGAGPPGRRRAGALRLREALPAADARQRPRLRLQWRLHRDAQLLRHVEDGVEGLSPRGPHPPSPLRLRWAGGNDRYRIRLTPLSSQRRGWDEGFSARKG